MKTEQIKLIVTANIQYTDGNRDKAIELAKYNIKSRAQWTESFGAEVERVEMIASENLPDFSEGEFDRKKIMKLLKHLNLKK